MDLRRKVARGEAGGRFVITTSDWPGRVPLVRETCHPPRDISTSTSLIFFSFPPPRYAIRITGSAWLLALLLDPWTSILVVRFARLIISLNANVYMDRRDTIFNLEKHSLGKSIVMKNFEKFWDLDNKEKYFFWMHDNNSVCIRRT